jgi:hypothetical protein
MPHYPRHRAPRNGNGGGLWKDIRGLLEPETGRGTAGLIGASLVPGVGEAIDVADFAAGLQDRDLARMGWATGGLLLPFVAGSTLRKVGQGVAKKFGRGAKAADELPMDEASRMARAEEQDWTTNAFHGTSRGPLGGGDLERFNWGSHFGTKEAANDRLLDLRSETNWGGDWSGTPYPGKDFPVAGERIMPVKLRGKFLDLGDEAAWHPEGLLQAAQERGLLTADEVKHAFDKVPQRRLRQAELGPNYNKHKHNEEVGIAMRQAVTDLFQKKGFAGVSYKNLVEAPGSTSYVVFDPKNVRSRFARFDPTQSESTNLLAGTVGLLGAGLARGQRERE